MLCAAARNNVEILRITTPACSRGRRSGARGTTAAATRATAPPIRASVHRTKAAPGSGTSVLTTIAWTAAWLTNRTPWLSSTAEAIARLTIRTICQPPDPNQWVSRSPTRTPMATPTVTSATRRRRCP
jgi:hypothetical protein